MALVGLVRDAHPTEIMPRLRNLTAGSIRTKSRPDDPVTDADVAAEARLTTGIAGLWPDAAVIGEEAVSAHPELLKGLDQHELAFVIDPIDGTRNFANCLAMFGGIVAVLCRGQTVFGLVYDPVMDDLVAAVRGGGAWFARPGQEPQPLHSAPTGPSRRCSASCRCTSFHVWKSHEPRNSSSIFCAPRHCGPRPMNIA